MRNKFTCDLCGVEYVDGHWDTTPLPMEFKTHCHSQNPMARHSGGFQENIFKLKEVCWHCHKAVAKALADVIQQRKEHVMPIEKIAALHVL